MRAFRFRAVTVLDLRVRQEEAATRCLGLAQAALDSARRAVQDAEIRLSDAMADCKAAQRIGADGGLLGWHHLWITRLRMDVDSKRAAVPARVADVERATKVVQDAHRARRVMERLRDRAFARFTREEQRASTKELDALASIRFVTRERVEGSTNEREREFGKRHLG